MVALLRHCATLTATSSPAELLDSISLGIEIITPEQAQHYLGKNFDNNRTKSREHIKELAKEMKNGEFFLSTDAIGFDSNGRLINGQHRLSAVAQSETSQVFIVARNLPPKTAQLIDVGKKRTMAQRITIGGTRMTEKQCSAIRNAMVPYEHKEVGTVVLARKTYDKYVEQVYLDHQDFFEHKSIKAFEAKSGSSFFLAAALRMFAQMNYQLRHGAEYGHEMDPFTRTCLWLELTREGLSQTYPVDPRTDNAAILLRNMKERNAVDSRGSRWCGKPQLRLTISGAYNFMQGVSPRSLKSHTYDPLIHITKLPSSNGFLNAKNEHIAY